MIIERAKSDPKGLWEGQIEWAKCPTAIQDVDRWLWVKGQEYTLTEKANGRFMAV